MAFPNPRHEKTQPGLCEITRIVREERGLAPLIDVENDVFCILGGGQAGANGAWFEVFSMGPVTVLKVRCRIILPSRDHHIPGVPALLREKNQCLALGRWSLDEYSNVSLDLQTLVAAAGLREQVVFLIDYVTEETKVMQRSLAAILRRTRRWPTAGAAN